MRLIDADALVYSLGASDRDMYVAECIEETPTVDAVEMVHGHWIEKPTGRYGKWQSWCSACNQHSGIGGIDSNRHRPFCPNCGAKMDGEVEWKYDKS